ncbi:MAG TPA: zinc-binding dehydrogenase [Candidatus Eisenbacteria bacterium]|nr:zinc-binding dehydrogenase [Candidatus Eisenbacteria bacterium]
MKPVTRSKRASAPAAPARGTMWAAQIQGPRSASVLRVDRPEPGPGEVLVRLEGSGVCGSHGALWEGRAWFQYPCEPGAPGHEGWGRIEALGEDVEELEVGARVTLLSYRAFAEYDVAKAPSVVPLPPELDDDPLPGEALGCAMNVFRRSDVRPGQDVAVIGVGFLGALLVQLASRTGARVFAVSRRAFARDIARRCGATETIPMDGSAAASILEATRGRGCDRVLEAVGHQEGLDLATALTAEGGRLVIAGYHQDGPRRVDMQTWNWRGIDVINAHERRPEVYIEGMRLGVEAVRSGALDHRFLVTHRFSLSELGGALDAIHTRPESFLKAVVSA